MDPKSQSNPSQKESVRKRNNSFGSEESKDAMDEGPDSLQDEASHIESLDSSMASTPGAEPSEHTTGARDLTTDREEGSKEASGRPGKSGKDKPNSPGDQTVKTAPSNTPTERRVEESKSVMTPTDQGKKSKSANKNMVNTREPVLDQNTNVESNGKQQGKTKQKEKNKSKTTEQKMVFGPQPPLQVTLINVHEARKVQVGLRRGSHGAAVQCCTSRPRTLAPVWTQRVQESVPRFRTLETNKDQMEPKYLMTFLLRLHRRGDEALPVVTPLFFSRHYHFDVCLWLVLLSRSRTGRTIDAKNRLTVCFHAVLSKDFNINPAQDQIFVKGGVPLGTWNENLAELSVTRY